MAPRIVLHATAYDALPSGAKSRAVGLAAAFLRLGCDVSMLSPRGLRFAPLVETEIGAPLPQRRWREVETDLDPSRPVARALAAARRLRPLVPEGTDLFLTDSHPVLDGVPTALTVHDFRDWQGRDRGARGARSALVRTRLPVLALRARCVVVPSEAMAREAVQRLGVGRDRVVVAPNAPSRVWREMPPPRGRGKHFAVVGAADPRKDLATVADAVRLARGELPPVVVAARRSQTLDALLARHEDLVRTGRMCHAGTPDDAALASLVGDAVALLHPSRYEGFGLPVVEAFAAGVPVMAASCDAVEEVAQGLATLLPPGDAPAWSAAMASAAGAPRTSGAAERRSRAADFSWDASAATLLRGAGIASPASGLVRPSGER